MSADVTLLTIIRLIVPKLIDCIQYKLAAKHKTFVSYFFFKFNYKIIDFNYFKYLHKNQK